LALPVDELLAEGDQPEPMFILLASKRVLLALQPFHIELQARAHAFEVVLTLADVGMNLVEVTAQLVPRLGETVERGARLLVDIGKFLDERLGLAPQTGKLVAGVVVVLLGVGLLRLPLLAFLAELLALPRHLTPRFLELLVLPAVVFLTLQELGALFFQLGG